MDYRPLVIVPLLLLACSGSPTTNSGTGPSTSDGGTGDGDGDGDAGSDGGGTTKVGDVPQLPVTQLCTQTDRIDSRDYGSKGALVGTWDLTKVCAENLLDHWNDTFNPANKALSVTGKARARWVFTDTTVQRTVSWEITQTFKITKIQQNETCEQNAARYTKALAQDTSPTNPRYDVRGRPVTCTAAASGDTFYACTCDVSFSSVSVDGERFTDAAPVGYLVSSYGVTTGDRKLDFKSDAASLTTSGEGRGGGLLMVLTKK